MSKEVSIVGVRFAGQNWAVLEVRIKNSNVYVNYFQKDGTAKAHTSYHASGQSHIKKGSDYVYWTGGGSGQWEPMKQFKMPPTKVIGREKVSVIGWEVASLGSVLPPLSPETEVLLEIPSEPEFSILGFEISVVGREAIPRTDILGFPVLTTKRISNGVAVEIEVFALKHETAE